VARKSENSRISFALFYGGFAALIAGTVKTPSHGAFQSICGSSFTMDQAIWLMRNIEHCWGCPVALTGLVLMVASFLRRARVDRFDDKRRAVANMRLLAA
jgi:hypothetical protein